MQLHRDLLLESGSPGHVEEPSLGLPLCICPGLRILAEVSYIVPLLWWHSSTTGHPDRCPSAIDIGQQILKSIVLAFNAA